jgi:hypothetical protein
MTIKDPLFNEFASYSLGQFILFFQTNGLFFHYYHFLIIYPMTVARFYNKIIAIKIKTRIIATDIYTVNFLKLDQVSF